MTPKHVVVVGHGMVGARFIEEVRRHDPAAHRVRFTVLGAEPWPAYNRILLPNLLSGTMREEDLLPNDQRCHAANHVDLRTGTAAVGLDTASQTITTSEGEQVGYDALVLATGARPRVPDLLSDVTTARSARLANGVMMLYTIADAIRLTTLVQAAQPSGGRIAVLGGGVLGLEAARALSMRGIPVTVVHRGGHLMDRQLDAPGGRVLAAALRRTGVEVLVGARAERWVPGLGLLLEDGLLPCAGLLLCTGAAPETGLARDAGLRLTEAGAVAVDDALTTSDPQVFAIGDCAGHPGAPGGLVHPGWEQAAVLASRLTGVHPGARYLGSGSVTRLKAAGIELTCLGSPFWEPGDAEYEVLRFEDPAREQYAKLVLADDKITGAIMIGLPDAAARIVQLYDRGAPAPADRLALLLGRALPPLGDEPGLAGLPDHAVVCRCNMVTKGQLRTAWHGGAATRTALSSATRAATGCGTCGDDLDALTALLSSTSPDPNSPDPDSPDRKEPALR